MRRGWEESLCEHLPEVANLGAGLETHGREKRMHVPYAQDAE